MSLDERFESRSDTVALEHRAKEGMVLKTSNGTYRILDIGTDSCLIEASDRAGLRGYADIYDGVRHLEHCLIVVAEPDQGMMRCAFKRRTLARDCPPLDFAR